MAREELTLEEYIELQRQEEHDAICGFEGQKCRGCDIELTDDDDGGEGYCTGCAYRVGMR